MNEILRSRRDLVALGSIVGTLAALAAGCGSSSPKAEATAIGSVECASGRHVEGVWVDVTNGKSGWAEWAAKDGESNKASYSYKLKMASKYTVHIGCGGNLHDWASQTWSEAVSSGEPHNFICDDSLTKPSSEPIVACEPEANPGSAFSGTAPNSTDLPNTNTITVKN